MEALKSLNSASKKFKEDVQNRNLRNSHRGKVKFLLYIQQQLTIKLGGFLQLSKHYQDKLVGFLILFLFIYFLFLYRKAQPGNNVT